MKTTVGFCALGFVTLLVGCDAGDVSAVAAGTTTGGAGGATSTTTGPGSTASGAGTTTGSGGSSPVSGLPVPPGAGGKPAPSGAAGDLEIVAWAGFKSAVSYTFDDAQPSQIEHWADLKKEDIRATFYLNTNAEGTEAGFNTTWDDALASGWELGNHTVHHCDANGTCPNGDTFTTIDQEFDDVTTYITTTAKQADAWTGAYPYGDTGWEPAAKTKFFLARGIYPGLIAPNGNTDPFNLPCTAAIAAGGEPASTFSGDIDQAETAASWLIFLFHTITPTTQSWYAPTDIGSITGSMDHAKSLGDMWIDTVANVGAYWMGQKVVTAATPTMAGGVSTWTWTLPARFPKGKFLRVTVDGGTLKQGGAALAWDPHGYYEVALDPGTLTLSP